jgi:hypothetical protein
VAGSGSGQQVFCGQQDDEMVRESDVGFGLYMHQDGGHRE